MTNVDVGLIASVCGILAFMYKIFGDLHRSAKSLNLTVERLNSTLISIDKDISELATGARNNARRIGHIERHLLKNSSFECDYDGP